jgi:hypothetical protein
VLDGIAFKFHPLTQSALSVLVIEVDLLPKKPRASGKIALHSFENGEKCGLAPILFT